MLHRETLPANNRLPAKNGGVRDDAREERVDHVGRTIAIRLAVPYKIIVLSRGFSGSRGCGISGIYPRLATTLMNQVKCANG